MWHLNRLLNILSQKQAENPPERQHEKPKKYKYLSGIWFIMEFSYNSCIGVIAHNRFSFRAV